MKLHGDRILTLELPYPPSVNHYYGHNRFGAVYVTPKGKEYRQMVALILMADKGVSFGAAPVSVRLGVHPPTKRRYDLDNLCKCLLDALTAAGVWEDDSQIQKLELCKMDPVKGGMVEVTVAGAD